MIDENRLMEWIQDLSRKGRILTVPDIRFICSELAKDTNVPDKWISVKDRLPEGECIAYSRKFGEMMMGFIGETDECDTGYCCDSSTEWLGDVTHWMPFPEPPKDGEVG